MEYFGFSGRGNKVNEDFFYIGSKFGFVIDGATGLTDSDIFQVGSDARWFSSSVGKLLKKRLKDESQSVQQTLMDICSQLKEQYGKQRELIDKNETAMMPSAAISIFRVLEENRIEIYQLGDAPILIERSNQEVEIIIDEKLSELDSQILDKMIKLAKPSNTGALPQKEKCRNLLKKNRMLKNKNNGYWILDLTGEGVGYGEYRLLDMKDIEKIIIMSDGFWEAQNVFHFFKETEELVEAIQTKESVEGIYDKLRLEQKMDSEGKCFPRMKIKDDATFILYKK